jgi:hypothetical protein
MAASNIATICELTCDCFAIAQIRYVWGFNLQWLICHATRTIRLESPALGRRALLIPLVPRRESSDFGTAPH